MVATWLIGSGYWWLRFVFEGPDSLSELAVLCFVGFRGEDSTDFGFFVFVAFVFEDVKKPKKPFFLADF